MKGFRNMLSGRYVIVLLILVFFTVAAGVIMSFAGSGEKEQTAVGMVLPANYGEIMAASAQYDGMKAACEEMNIKLIVRKNSDIELLDDDIRALSEQGIGMIFLSTPGYVQAAKALVGSYPDIAFSTSTPNQYKKNMTGYFIRMFEGRYYAGVAAGMMSDSNVVGYCTGKETGEVRADINAFAMGVRKVKPDARILVITASSEELMDGKIKRAVRENKLDVITYHRLERNVEKTADELGIDYIGAFSPSPSKSPHHLFDVCISWKMYFIDMLKSYKKGDLNYVDNHWTGRETGTVYLTGYSERVTPEARKKVQECIGKINDGEFIFTGPVYDNSGVLRINDGDIMPDSAMMSNLSWYVKGVEKFD